MTDDMDEKIMSSGRPWQSSVVWGTREASRLRHEAVRGHSKMLLKKHHWDDQQQSGRFIVGTSIGRV